MALNGHAGIFYEWANSAHTSFYIYDGNHSMDCRMHYADLAQKTSNVVDVRRSSKNVRTIIASSGTLDVNGRLDGVDSGDLGAYGTFDIAVGGTSKNDVNDYYASHEKNTNYSITDIKAKPGYDYIGVVSGATSGTITAGSTINVRLSFATQGHLFVQGNLDGITDSSIEGYGTFDVYINDALESSNCTSYNKQWPKNTRYEIRNIRVADGKNYDGLSSFSGTITSNTESKVVLPFTTNGTATPDWQMGKVVPGNLNRETLDVEYKHHYETVATSSPGSEWVQAGVNRTYYQNSGSVQEFPYEQATSDTYVYVGGYYYHWCGSNHDCNYQKTSGKYETYHGPNGLDAFDVVSSGTDTNNSNVKWYKLNWKSGQIYSGAATCATNQTNAWYRMYQYQPRVLITEYKWTKDKDWQATYDSDASSYTVRWRLKDGVETDYKGLQLNFSVDGENVSSLDGIATIDVYINGEQKANNATSFRSFYPGEFAYEIHVNNVVVDKLYKQVEGGELSGTVTEDLKTLTLCFETGVVSEPDWKIIPENVVPYVDENSEIEYRHHYETVSTTSPGEGWVQAGINRTYYENSGSVQEFPYEQTTSDTFVYVGGYYYHWCGSNHDCNYQKTAGKYETYHGPNSLDMFDVVSSGTDTNNSNVKWYKLNWKSGQVYSGAATCATNQTNAWYRMYQYQPRVKITEYKWTKVTDWTSELDTTATSVEYRIRLKQFVITFAVGDGEFDIESITKYSGVDLELPVDIPTRDLYSFVAWNTEPDGTGAAYLPGAMFTENQDTILHARWKELAALNLPNGLTAIEEEAFSNVNALIIRIPSSCTTIKSQAFANNSKLQRIYVPSTTTSIALDAFDGCPNLTIYAPAGSTAIRVAKYNDIPYEEVNDQ
ncbi:MAG: leucine-rich repeat domain-containing protein [Clostridia bacterium]|nr:leucine-rich repeat domain-containing protein [Clostridia bacterium]